ncbi:MAG: tRNA glutamyl-Q(34) synthetase GluQRS [Clostridiales bacterium]|nr:tRNA glutamyl-Q(34) synthetase GluQRS [Clostridiales bacterium]
MANEEQKINVGTPPVGRFAPTPSGDMHFGNLLCALLAYLSAKSRGGRFIVRVEDLDTVRCPRSAAQRISDALERFGLISDEPPIYQSERSEAYRRAETVLEKAGLTYPCYCTRAELLAAEAPRLSDGGVVYAGTCKHLTAERKAQLGATRKPCTRVTVPAETITFTDVLRGEVKQNLATECGDFIIKRSDGVYAYQLAVAVDDATSGVTEVVRGCDLLTSTPRQIWLMRLLGYAPPTYCHMPLVCDSRGRKLSKSEGDKISERLSAIPKERILGALAYAAGLIDTDRAAALDELTEIFTWSKIKKDSIYLPEILC